MTANPSQPKPLLPIVWALEEGRRRRYSSVDRLILIVLANHMNGTRECWPSVAALATECDCSTRQVQRALPRFRDDGLIAIEPGTGRGFTSRYRLLASVPDQADLFGEQPQSDKVPSKPRDKGDSQSPIKPKKVPGSHPLPREKGDSLRKKRVTQSHRESTKKNPPVQDYALRAKTAAAVSHLPPSSATDFDPRKALWTEGVEALRGLTGQMNGEAKRQIGRFLKLAGGDAVGVLRALEVAKVEGPYEPIPWISAAIQARASTRLSPQEELRKRWNLPTFMAPNLDPEA